MGTLRLLEMLRDIPEPPKFFHAASSEIFGRPDVRPQKEDCALNPLSPYACAKAFAVQLVRVYRSSFNLFAVNGILYNHESSRRGEGFVTKKICKAACRIAAGLEDCIYLGDIEGARDWGYAPDYVKGMWLSLQNEVPEDYIFSTGALHSIQDVLEIAFTYVGLNWSDYYKRDDRFIRPQEPAHLVGDSSKAYQMLGWKHSISFRELIYQMVDHEFQILEKNNETSLFIKHFK